MPPIRRNRRSKVKKNIPAVSTKLLDLNDDCFSEIFSYLQPVDMCAVKDTCRRLRELSEQQMASYYRTNEFVLSDQRKFRFKRQVKLFYKFCNVFTKLNIALEDIDWRRSNDELLSTIRSCNPALDSLTITDSDFDVTGTRLHKFLKNLRKIKLEYYYSGYQCDIRREEIIAGIFRACSKVEEISFGAKKGSIGSCYQGVFLQQRFKNLRSLELYEVRDFDLNNLKLCLNLNPNIQKITLKRCVGVTDFRDFDIPKNMANIQGFSFRPTVHQEYHGNFLQINGLAELNNLKYLALDTCNVDVTDLITRLANQNSLVFLSLIDLRIKINEKFPEALQNMSNLKVLRLQVHFYGDLTPNYENFFKILCSNLINLDELHLFDCFITTKQVEDIIESSINLKKLYFPSTNIFNGIYEEEYRILVDKQKLKNSNCQLTIYLQREVYAMAMDRIPRWLLQMHRDVIKISLFDPSGFDEYGLPDVN